MPKIFIDPGHGGRDPGAVANGMRESDVVLEISLILRDLLRQNFDVRLSRETDISPSQRWQIANNWGADLLVSIHCNAGGGTGVETIIPTASPNNRNRDLQTNRRLAENISNALGGAFNLRIRRANGVMLETETRHDFVGVLRNSSMPAIMPEIAFIDSLLSNPDVDILRNRRREVAQVLASEIYKCFGMEIDMSRFNTVAELPGWARMDIQELVNAGHMRGDGTVTPNGDVSGLDLTLDMIRTIILNKRQVDELRGAIASLGVKM